MDETTPGPRGPRRRTALRLPHLTGIERARIALRDYLPETPLVRSELLSRALAAEIWLKNETASPIASFKLRGALTALLRSREAGGPGEAVTSSTGNHGQGVAYAGEGSWHDGPHLPPERREPRQATDDRRPGRDHPRGGRRHRRRQGRRRALRRIARPPVRGRRREPRRDGRGRHRRPRGRGAASGDRRTVRADGKRHPGGGLRRRAEGPPAPRARGHGPVRGLARDGRELSRPPGGRAADRHRRRRARVPGPRSPRAGGALGLGRRRRLHPGRSPARALRALVEHAHVLVEPAGAAGLAAAGRRGPIFAGGASP